MSKQNRPKTEDIAVVLGSGSPRRRELLAGLGIEFKISAADIDETPRPGEQGVPYVERLAREKARAVGSAAHADSVVIAADTIVEQDGILLGKPADVEEAKRMLATLSDNTHRVHTGVAVTWRGQECASVATTTVRFHPMSDEEISWYVSTGEPMDKAGSYGIQAHGALFVAALEGSYFNVVGLPIDLLYRLVQDVGVAWQRLERR